MKSCQIKLSKPIRDVDSHASADPKSKLMAFFQDLGLKPNEQKLLAALIVANDDAGVDELSKMTGVRHDEVYENLSSLGRQGLVSCAFANHRRFVAPSFSDIVDQLLSSEYEELTNLRNRAQHYQKVVEKIRSRNEGDQNSKATDRIRMLAGRQRLESKVAEMAEKCRKTFHLVITEQAFRSLAHTALFSAIDTLSGRGVIPEIVVPSYSIAACIKERGNHIKPRVAGAMSADSVSFAITDESEILVIPAESDNKWCGICSANLSFIASFASYSHNLLDQAGTHDKK
jgi:sugar-specific transcriptional regulator TrmB